MSELGRVLIKAIFGGALLALLVIALVPVVRPAAQKMAATPTARPIGVAAQPIGNSYRHLVKKISPAVVAIRTAIAPRSKKEQMQLGLGSGVVLSSDGYIVTNYHVIQSAQAIAVDVIDGRAYPARIIGVDPDTDLAVLKIDQAQLTPILLAQEPAQVGDIVLAVGYPVLLGQTVTQGIVSATERLEQGFIRLVQTDAAINKGNSGGALVNLQGELVGINSEVLPTQLGVQGIGFAIQAQLVQKIVQDILSNGHVVRGSLGFSGTGALNEIHNSEATWRDRAVHVDAVDSLGPSARAGLQINDYITHINGDLTNGVSDMLQHVADAKPGSLLRVRINRDGHEMELQIVVAERKIEKLKIEPAARTGS